MTLINILAVILAVFFGLTGAMKVLALAPARQLAADVHYSIPAYRMIGVLELAGAAGVIIAIFAFPLLGVLAALGLLTLMGAALGTHVRNGDPVGKAAPAVVLGLLAAGYVVAAYWTT
jgi:hypothetical protein